MNKIIPTIFLGTILFLTSIPVTTNADNTNNDNDQIIDREKNVFNFSGESYKDLLLIYGTISDLVISKHTENDVTFIYVDFYAESVHIRGGHPARAGGWGVVPPEHYDEWITNDYVSVLLEKDDIYYRYETKGIITNKFIFLFQLVGSLPFSKLLSILWIAIAPFLNNIYPIIEPLLNPISQYILTLWDYIRFNPVYLMMYHAFEPLRNMSYQFYEKIQMVFITIFLNIYPIWLKLRHIFDNIFNINPFYEY